ncbi:diaminopimelate epimerase, partial [Pseudomonas aeruginosa]
VDMSPPRLAPAEIPFQAEREALSYEIEVNGQRVELAAVSMGNTHGGLRVANVDSAPVRSLGPPLEVHTRLPKKANIGFLQVL